MTARVQKPLREAERAQAPGAPAAGSIAQRPAHVSIGELGRRRATGRLDLEGPDFSARIHFVEGFVAAASGSDERLHAGPAEAAAGKLPRARLDEARALAASRGISLPEALRATGAFDDRALAAALARQATAVVERACAIPDGTWRFEAGAAPPPWPLARLHALALVDAGVRAAYPTDTIRAWLERFGDARPVADPALAGVLAAAGIASMLPARLEAEDATALARSLNPSDLALIFALAGAGYVGFARADRGHGARPASVGTDEARPSGRGRPLDAAERAAIEAEHQRLQTADHYQALGVARDATAEEVRRAFIAAAKRWHSDAFAGRDLGELAPLVEKNFARIAEAHEVLSDPAERAEYDVFLERKAKGLPTDVAAVFQAEEAFHKAQAHLRAQRYADAEALLRQAVELNPAEAEFWAHLGAAVYRARGRGGVEEARAAFARARALIPDSLVTDYLEAQLEIGEGELDAAERRLRKILLEKPDHAGAQQLLRGLRERKEKETATGRGFFGTLWKRK